MTLRDSIVSLLIVLALWGFLAWFPREGRPPR
jgi:hypothetical protein